MSDPRGPFDLVVIGGGISGCGVARQAAMRGLCCLVVERGDVACGTSSRSTKLLHGGLRYLEHGDFSLVRQALRERETTARLAPHLAEPLEIVLPTRSGVFPGRLAARAGVLLYEALGGARHVGRAGSLTPADLRRAAPGLADRPWTGGVAFRDRRTDDARLTVAIARDAVRRGASIRTGWECVEVLLRNGAARGARIRDVETGATEDVPCGAVVNAAGPWADSIRALAGLREPALRTTRGSHLVLPDLGLTRGLLLSGARRGHRLFALPWRGATLFGTTEEDDRGDPARTAAPAEDVELLLREAEAHFPALGRARPKVLAAFSALRPLARESGDPLAVSREHRVLAERGLYSLVGGKLTTWRAMAEDLLDRVAASGGPSGPRAPVVSWEPLPGGDAAPSRDDPRLAGLGAETVAELLALYGSEAVEVAAAARDAAGAAEPVAGGPWISAQIDFAVSREMARHPEDVLLRRLPLSHDPARARAALPQVARRMATRLGWAPDREAAEVRRAEAAIAALMPWVPPRVPPH